MGLHQRLKQVNKNICVRGTFWLIVGLLLSIPVMGATPKEGELKTQLKILVKAVSYDQNLQIRCASGMKVGVVSKSGDEGAATLSQQVADGFNEFSDKKIKGIDLSFVPLQVTDASQLFRMVDAQQINTLYLVAGVESMAPQIMEFARKKKILVMTTDSAYMNAGACIGVTQGESKQKIVVFLEGCAAQGVKFDARLLRLAEVIEPDSVYQAPEAVAGRRISGQDPEYPYSARSSRQEGTVEVKVSLAPDGSVKSINFIRTHEYFEAIVREAIQGWKFSPHQVNGRLTATHSVFKFVFKPN